jgi:hypothetical protein
MSCNALRDPLTPIVIGKANLRFSKSQFDIMENYKPFITKGFVSLIGSQTVKVKWKAHNFVQIYTFLDRDFNTLIENRNTFQFA